MKHAARLILLFTLIFAGNVSAQEVLPGLTVKNFSGKIIVSWQNEYTKPVSNIIIQRSYDSLKNYTSIGSVLNPQNKENGYADANPPYTKMYYRVSITFEGGTYVISPPVRPIKIIPVVDISKLNTSKFPWQVSAYTDSVYQKPPNTSVPSQPFPVSVVNDSTKSIPNPVTIPTPPPVKKNEITYPSQRIYTAKDNTVVIHLPDAATKKYTAKFYDDADNFLFELTKLHEEYLMLEKVNFTHAGWFRFELFEDGKLIEKNKFQVGKDTKNGNK